MKKLFTIGMALLISGSAFAQEVKPVEVKKGPEFKYSIWANAFAVTEETVQKNEKKQYSNVRVRPMFTLTNENVSAVTRLEIDQTFGAKYSSGTGNDVSYADPDGDEKAVEVKWAYINVKDMIVPGLSVTAGLAPYVYSVGLNNDMPMFNLIYDAGVAKLDLAYIKFVEGSTTDHSAATAATSLDGANPKDDAQAYAGKLPLNLGDITVTPSVLYYKGQKNVLKYNSTTTVASALGYDQKLTMPALGVAAKLGDVTFNADFQYIMGEQKYNDATPTKKVNAYAGYLNGGFKASDSFKVNIFGLYSSGEDAKNNTTTSFQSASQDEVEVGPMFIINDNGLINQVGVSNEYDKATEGLMMGGLSAEFKLDKFTALAQVAYARTASDKVGTAPVSGIKKTVIGTEMDLRLSYEVAPKTSLWAEGAFIAAGNYNKEKYAASGKQNPIYYAAGLMTSF